MKVAGGREIGRMPERESKDVDGGGCTQEPAPVRFSGDAFCMICVERG